MKINKDKSFETVKVCQSKNQRERNLKSSWLGKKIRSALKPLILNGVLNGLLVKDGDQVSHMAVENCMKNKNYCMVSKKRWQARHKIEDGKRKKIWI